MYWNKFSSLTAAFSLRVLFTRSPQLHTPISLTPASVGNSRECDSTPLPTPSPCTLKHQSTLRIIRKPIGKRVWPRGIHWFPRPTVHWNLQQSWIIHGGGGWRLRFRRLHHSAVSVTRPARPADSPNDVRVTSQYVRAWVKWVSVGSVG